MAGIYWREAASLIVIGKQSKLKVAPDIIKDFKKLNPWNANYSSLFLKRSSKSSFMPGVHVFPGGELDEADISTKWLSIFDHHGYSKEDLVKHFRPRFANETMADKLIPELAFRICAIRETFEETGLLFIASKDMLKKRQPCLFSMQDDDRKEWRSKVHNNAFEFLNLFQELKRLPCVWSLHDWSRWLTPTYYGSPKRRFDTRFFVTFIDHEIPLYANDKSESDEIEILRPVELLESYYKKTTGLAPPQLYELARFLNFSDFQDFKKFAEFRAEKGMSMWLPVRVIAKDGYLSVLPGDDLYPTDPDMHDVGKGDLVIDETLEDSKKKCKYLNRFELLNPWFFHVSTNIIQECGHVSPVSLSSIIKV